MVLLVKSLIQRAQMEDPVGAVEEGLAGQHAEEEISYEFFQRGEFCVDSDAGGQALCESCVEQGAVEGEDDGLVADADEHGVEDIA